MGELSAKPFEANFADDFSCPEILKFGGVRPRLRAEPDQKLGTLKIAVMIGGDVGDEIGWMV
jgi:hypothetical protein